MAKTTCIILNPSAGSIRDVDEQHGGTAEPRERPDVLEDRGVVRGVLERNEDAGVHGHVGGDSAYSIARDAPPSNRRRRDHPSAPPTVCTRSHTFSAAMTIATT